MNNLILSNTPEVAVSQKIQSSNIKGCHMNIRIAKIALINNIIKYIYRDIVFLKRDIRKELFDCSYKQLSKNIFVDGSRHIVIFKSFVRTTNQNEWKFLTTTQKMYNQIKDMHITIILIERNTKASKLHKMYKVEVKILTPTNSIRSKKYNYKRYIINNFNKKKI